MRDNLACPRFSATVFRVSGDCLICAVRFQLLREKLSAPSPPVKSIHSFDSRVRDSADFLLEWPMQGTNDRRTVHAKLSGLSVPLDLRIEVDSGVRMRAEFLQKWPRHGKNDKKTIHATLSAPLYLFQMEA